MLFTRPATEADVASASRLLCQGIARGSNGLRIDVGRMEEFCRGIVRDHYATVAEEEGAIVAYLGGVIAPHPWFGRNQLTVVGWYSVRPWAGMRLMRECLTWARGQMGITSVYLGVDAAQSDRVGQLLASIGVPAIPAAGYMITV